MSYTSVTDALRNVIVTNPQIILKGLAQKVYPQVLPQNEVVPAITYTLVVDIPYDTVDGVAGLYRGVVEYKIWSKDAEVSGVIEELLRLSIQGYKGLSLGVNIRGVHHLGSSNDFEPEVSEYNKVSRFSVFHRRENPDFDDS